MQNSLPAATLHERGPANSPSLSRSPISYPVRCFIAKECRDIGIPIARSRRGLALQHKQPSRQLGLKLLLVVCSETAGDGGDQGQLPRFNRSGGVWHEPSHRRSVAAVPKQFVAWVLTTRLWSIPLISTTWHMPARRDAIVSSLASRRARPRRGVSACDDEAGAIGVVTAVKDLLQHLTGVGGVAAESRGRQGRGFPRE